MKLLNILEHLFRVALCRRSLRTWTHLRTDVTPGCTERAISQLHVSSSEDGSVWWKLACSSLSTFLQLQQRFAYELLICWSSRGWRKTTERSGVSCELMRSVTELHKHVVASLLLASLQIIYVNVFGCLGQNKQATQQVKFTRMMRGEHVRLLCEETWCFISLLLDFSCCYCQT